MDGKTYGSLNFETYMGDSSNHVKDGAIGIPEQMQERGNATGKMKMILPMTKEEKTKQEKTVVARIINYLMGKENL